MRKPRLRVLITLGLSVVLAASAARARTDEPADEGTPWWVSAALAGAPSG